MSEEASWQKSSFSTGNTNCVELALLGGEILVRESIAPQVVLTTSPEKLRAFLAGVKAGEFGHHV
ncbi:DUF397 domain-containing protein [Streptomyces sp. PSRA5]